MNRRTHSAAHRLETDSRTAAISIYGRLLVAELEDGEINSAYLEGYRYCARCQRFYLADYHQSEIGEGLGHEFCCAFCAAEWRKTNSEQLTAAITPRDKWRKLW